LQNKLKAITKDTTVTNFPNEQPDIEWNGNAIHLLEFFGLNL
jgi:hypothetical protein